MVGHSVKQAETAAVTAKAARTVVNCILNWAEVE
jgi:hypothetical protein